MITIFIIAFSPSHLLLLSSPLISSSSHSHHFPLPSPPPLLSSLPPPIPSSTTSQPIKLLTYSFFILAEPPGLLPTVRHQPSVRTASSVRERRTRYRTTHVYPVSCLTCIFSHSLGAVPIYCHSNQYPSLRLVINFNVLCFVLFYLSGLESFSCTLAPPRSLLHSASCSD